MEAPLTVGQILRATRTENKLTQEAIAEILGVCPEHVAAMERSRRRMPLRYVGILTEALLGIDAKKLRAAIEREANPLMFRSRDAVQSFSGLISGNKGTVAVINGLGSEFPGKQMLGSWHSYLQTDGAQVVFIQPNETEGVFTPSKRPGGLKIVRETISWRGNADVAKRINFYSLVPPENVPPEHAGKVRALSRLLHPLTATILFEPEQDAELRAGLTYMRTGLERAGKGEYVWVRLTSNYLGQLSGLLRDTLWSIARPSLLQDVAVD